MGREEYRRLRLFEREDLLRKALYLLGGSPLRKTLLFHGGGALHFVYGSPRFSRDLDFEDDTLPSSAGYLEELKRVGENFNVNAAKRVYGGRGIRAKWGDHGGLVAKVEIDSRKFGEGIIPHGFDIMTKTAEGILTDKIYATIARYVEQSAKQEIPIKPSDLFDINYIAGFIGAKIPDREQLEKRAETYGCNFSKLGEAIESIAHLISSEKNYPYFVTFFKRSLLPDVFEAMKSRFNRDYFSMVADVFLKVKP